jgi:peroxin-6
VIEDALESLRSGAKETGWPCMLLGTVVDPDVVPGELLGVFKQDIVLSVSLNLGLANDRLRMRLSEEK